MMDSEKNSNRTSRLSHHVPNARQNEGILTTQNFCIRINYSAGNPSRQIGHCNRNLIQPSKQAVWKICRHGVTM